ncbi:pentapeptide repeat-containing protein [Candidatus Nephthysia bennettiae]|uniref:Pentapeptide repeat-containing protein n=1 Tax=Candidatus Nephthysia bennettiae TaxID=3127016 RepID=A0A934N9W4_9BACT|nr:pentapeptide repeat-containing protein [Candidatus Dormibacteraeota bacterium]MBJ7614461.1 pentapeptide repeat-containing protein [Candidatus Dormibacteraeota bacterium]
MTVALVLGCSSPFGADHGRTCGSPRGQDLSSRTVDGYTLSQHQLVCANLEHSVVSGQQVDEANLHRANLHRAGLGQSTLNHVDLSGADLSGASLHEASLTSVNLNAATLPGADLSGMDFRFGTCGDRIFRELTCVPRSCLNPISPGWLF